MRFDDEYKKSMDQKSLSEDFIQDLCAKMTAKANQAESENQNKSMENNETHTLETHAIEYTSKTQRKKHYPYMIAAAAAFLIICTAAVKNIRDHDNIINPDNEITQQPAIQAETSITSVTSQVSGVSKVTNVLNNVVTEPVQTQKEPEQTAQVPQRSDDGSFNTADGLISFINSRKAEYSPIAVGYKQSGIANLFKDFYDVSYSDTSYSYSIKDVDVFKSSPLNYSLYDEAGTVSQINNSISSEDLEQFNRIFKQIDKEAGQENYYIYDAYKFTYYSKAQSDSNGGFTNQESTNYRVEIVTKDYYSEYLNNPCRDNVVMSYEVRNDLDYNSDLTSEYQYFLNEEKKANEFYSEFTDKFTDCVMTIGNVDTEYTGTNIYRPFTTWFRPTSGPDDNYRSNMAALTNACYLPEKEGTPGSDASVYIYACLFFKPGTNPDDINSKLKEMKPVFDKYNVLCVTVDILNSESDYNAYKNGSGFGNSNIINSSYRRYCATYSDEFPDWSAK